MQAFEEIETKVVSENVFSQFMYKSLPSPQSLWVLKRYMCVQTALSGAPYCRPPASPSCPSSACPCRRPCGVRRAAGVSPVPLCSSGTCTCTFSLPGLLHMIKHVFPGRRSRGPCCSPATLENRETQVGSKILTTQLCGRALKPSQVDDLRIYSRVQLT